MVTSKQKSDTALPIIIDLGRKSRKQVKNLERGKGSLADLIQTEEHAALQASGTPIYLVARKEKKTKSKIEEKAKKLLKDMFKSRGRAIENEGELARVIFLG